MEDRLAASNVGWIFKVTNSTCKERQSHCGGRGWRPQGLVPFLCHPFSCSLPYLSTSFQQEKETQSDSDIFFIYLNVSSVERILLPFFGASPGQWLALRVLPHYQNLSWCSISNHTQHIPALSIEHWKQSLHNIRMLYKCIRRKLANKVNWKNQIFCIDWWLCTH